MSWFEWGPFYLGPDANQPTGVDISNLGLSSPTITSETSYDVTDPDSVSAVDITTLSGSVTTSIYTTPQLSPAAANKTYHLDTLLADSGNTYLVRGIIISGDR